MFGQLWQVLGEESVERDAARDGRSDSLETIPRWTMGAGTKHVVTALSSDKEA